MLTGSSLLMLASAIASRFVFSVATKTPVYRGNRLSVFGEEN